MLKITYLGRDWPFGGDLFYITHPNGHEARVYVDSIGETWVDIRRIPEGGYFHSERVEAYRAFNGSIVAERELRERGFDTKRIPEFAGRVRERDL